MKITLELYGTRYTVEQDSNAQDAGELVEIFTRMLVQAGFSPGVIQPREGGRYECEYIGSEDDLK